MIWIDVTDQTYDLENNQSWGYIAEENMTKAGLPQVVDPKIGSSVSCSLLCWNIPIPITRKVGISEETAEFKSPDNLRYPGKCSTAEAIQGAASDSYVGEIFEQFN